jgi:hypothetical protein
MQNVLLKFQNYFNHYNEERLQLLKTQQAKYQANMTQGKENNNKPSTMETKLKTLKKELAATKTLLEKAITMMKPCNNRQLNNKTNGIGYCWTHGIVLNPSHNSKNCCNKAPGHKNEATIDNMLGGNTTEINRPSIRIKLNSRKEGYLM